MPKKLTTPEFVFRAEKIHGDKYDYSKVKYIKINTDVIIICPDHGEFPQLPSNHLRGKGCSKCAGNAKKNTEKFINDALKV